MVRNSGVYGGVLVLAVAALLNGCTTQLTATPVKNGTKQVTGQVYYLPRVDYVISLNRELQKCTFGRANEVDMVLDWMRDSAKAMSNAPEDKKFLPKFNSIFADKVLKRPEIVAGVYSRFVAAHTPLADYSPAKAASDAGRLTASGLSGAICQLVGRPEAAGKPAVCQKPADVPDGATQLAIAMRDVIIDDPTVQIGVEMSATITAHTTADPAHIYSLHYAGMRQWLKGTDYSVEAYPNGALKSINVTLDDQTGAVIQSVISGAAKIAAATGGFPLGVTAERALLADHSKVQSYDDWKKNYDANLEKQTPCSADVRLKLMQRKALTAALEEADDVNLEQEVQLGAAQAALAKAIAAHDDQKTIVDGMADDDKKKKAELAKLKALEEALKNKKSLLAAAQLKQEGELAHAGKLATRLAALRKSLTIVHTAPFVVEQDNYTMVIGGEDQALDKWLDMKRVAQLCTPSSPDSVPCKPSPLDQARSDLRAQAAIVPLLSGRQTVEPLQDKGGEVNVVYRQPASTTLLVCRKVDCLKNNVLFAAEEYRVATAKVEVPQLGILASLPLANGPFQNNTLAASFAESGALTKVEYKSNAAAAKAASVFESSADSFLKFKEAKLKEETSKLTQSNAEVTARTTLLKSQLELAKAQAELDAYRKAQVKVEAEKAP